MNTNWSTILDNLFHILNEDETLLNTLFTEFDSLNIADPDEVDNKFWHKYGSAIINENPRSVTYSNRLHIGSIDAYKDLLSKLEKKFPDKYKTAHKGTPFCILGSLLIDV